MAAESHGALADPEPAPNTFPLFAACLSRLHSYIPR